MSQRSRVQHPAASQAGFSLAEMLSVLALLGIVIAIGIPLVNEQVRIADVRSAADQMAVHMRAARMIAVSHHKPIDFNVSVDPANEYSYEDTHGQTRTVTMPVPVKLVSGSAATITFNSNGSTVAAGTVTIESIVSNKTERWTLTVNTMGMVSVVHTRI